MIQKHLLDTVPNDKYDLLKKEEVVTLYKQEEKMRINLQRENERLRAQLNMADQKSLFLNEEYVSLKHKIFGKSSEKSPRDKKKKKKNRGKRVQLPSERYPNVPVVEQEIELEEMPNCPCCEEKMQDSGMWEESEFITVIPKRYHITRQKRKKYRCKRCQGGMKTAPNPPRIVPGGSYSDELILDVALSKFCDLIPIERYSEMAFRQSLINLPPQSLIGMTHYLSNFVKGAALRCEKEVKDSKIIRADETPHRMLERNEGKKNWYLWGFSSEIACIFNIENTRSGDVASGFLDDSRCRYLMSDVYTGYAKAVREVNEKRREEGLALIIKLYCNAHARRKFNDIKERYPEESEYFLKKYRQIYRWEKIVRKLEKRDRKLKGRKLMFNRFRLMKKKNRREDLSIFQKKRDSKGDELFLQQL